MRARGLPECVKAWEQAGFMVDLHIVKPDRLGLDTEVHVREPGFCRATPHEFVIFKFRASTPTSMMITATTEKMYRRVKKHMWEPK